MQFMSMKTCLIKELMEAKRSMIFHEATHTKYHDSAMGGMIKQAGFWSGAIGTYAALKACNVIKLRKSLSGTAGAIVSMGLAFEISSIYGKTR